MGFSVEDWCNEPHSCLRLIWCALQYTCPVVCPFVVLFFFRQFISWAIAILVWAIAVLLFCFVNFLEVSMSGENSIVRLNGKNYASWEFQFRMFVKRNELWGHLDGSSTAPIDSKELSSWEGKDAKIASWLLNSIEPHMVNNLHDSLLVKRCEITFGEFIFKIILPASFNWSWTSETIAREICLLSNFIWVLLIYGMIILGWCILKFQKQL